MNLSEVSLQVLVYAHSLIYLGSVIVGIRCAYSLSHTHHVALSSLPVTLSSVLELAACSVSVLPPSCSGPDSDKRRQLELSSDHGRTPREHRPLQHHARSGSRRATVTTERRPLIPYAGSLDHRRPSGEISRSSTSLQPMSILVLHARILTDIPPPGSYATEAYPPFGHDHYAFDDRQPRVPHFLGAC